MATPYRRGAGPLQAPRESPRGADPAAPASVPLLHITQRRWRSSATQPGRRRSPQSPPGTPAAGSVGGALRNGASKYAQAVEGVSLPDALPQPAAPQAWGVQCSNPFRSTQPPKLSAKHNIPGAARSPPRQTCKLHTAHARITHPTPPHHKLHKSKRTTSMTAAMVFITSSVRAGGFLTCGSQAASGQAGVGWVQGASWRHVRKTAGPQVCSKRPGPHSSLQPPAAHCRRAHGLAPPIQSPCQYYCLCWSTALQQPPCMKQRSCGHSPLRT